MKGFQVERQWGRYGFIIDDRRGQDSRQRDKGDRISGRETEETEHSGRKTERKGFLVEWREDLEKGQNSRSCTGAKKEGHDAT